MNSASSNDPHGSEELARRQANSREMGGKTKIDRQHAQGRLTARERVEYLLDPGSFLETGLLAHSERPEAQAKTPADGKICGYGTINGQTICITADDATVLAGSGGRIGYQKEYETHEYARKRGYPSIHLGDGGGARIPDIMGATGMMRFTVPISHPPRDRETPMITIIMGECYGGPSWKAAMSDVVIQVKGSVMAVSGPPVLQAATRESVSPEELGGWEVHARKTGLVDLFAETDQEALQLARLVLDYLPRNCRQLPPRIPAESAATTDWENFLEVMPRDPRKVYDMNQLLASLVDPGSLLPFKPQYDGSLITALARLDGRSVGILANNPKVMAGAMGPGACEKAIAFIAFCDSFHIPLLFLHDTPGFYVSKAAEARKMPQKIMSFIDAIHHSTVPRIALIVRKSYGMAHCNMVGANMGADFLLAWPKAEISFMSPLVAAEVVLGRKLAQSDDPEAMRQAFLDEMDRMNAPWEAAGENLIDRIIDPKDTRQELIRSLDLACGQESYRFSQRKLANWPRMT
jgi:acetyl-CoA carboxylase carboxyltransferase component